MAKAKPIVQGLTMDEEHRYWWNGKRVPGMNEVLKAVGIAKNYPENGDPFYRERGTAVHLAIDLYVKGTLDEESLDPIIIPYFNQARKWLDARHAVEICKYRSDGTEMMKYSEKHGVAGTIDMIYKGKIYDWKCTAKVTDDTELKGAFYKEIFGLDSFAAIQLDGSEGPAIEIPYEAGPELVDAVMTLYRKWKRK